VAAAVPAVVGAGTATAIAVSQATSVATAVASAVATAVAGISISIAYVAGQTVRAVTAVAKDVGRSVLSAFLRAARYYFNLLVAKPEIGLTATLLLIYLLT